MGWDYVALFAGDFIPPSQGIPPLPAVIQAWLYDGVLQFFSTSWITLAGSDIVSHDKCLNLSVINTATLESSISEFKTFVRRWPLAELKEWMSGIMNLRLVLENIHRMNIAHVASNVYPIDGSLIFSIVLLWEFLGVAFVDLFRDQHGGFFRPPCGYIMQKLHENFWCPREIVRLKSQTVLYYVSQLGPRKRRLYHKSCSEDECKEASIDVSSYKTLHSFEGCTCQDTLEFDTDDLVTVWLENKIPIVVFDMCTREWEMSAIEPGQGSYTAISHLWSDGLGNPKANILPICQAERIQSEVQSIGSDANRFEEPKAWWIDTLCVPVKNCEKSPRPWLRKLARKKAIAAMNDIYAHASVVLVRDSELDQSYEPGTDYTLLEIAFRFSLCPWSFRVWTFLEAQSAKNLVVAAAGDIIPVSYMQGPPPSRAESYEDLTGWLSWYAWRMLATYCYDFKLNSMQKCARVGLVASVMFPRNTSSIGDELIYLAIVSEYPRSEIEPLVDCDIETQVCRFLLSTGKIDPMAAVLPGTRVDAPFFQWAPKRPGLHMGEAACDMHDVTVTGLRGSWVSVSFQAPCQPMRAITSTEATSLNLMIMILAKDSSSDTGLKHLISLHNAQLKTTQNMHLKERGHILFFCCGSGSVFLLFTYDITFDDFKTNGRSFDRVTQLFESMRGQKLAILTQDTPDSDGHFIEHRRLVILVQVVNEIEGINYAKRLCCVEIIDANPIIEGYVHSLGNVFEAKLDDTGSQIWCLQ